MVDITIYLVLMNLIIVKQSDTSSYYNLLNNIKNKLNQKAKIKLDRYERVLKQKIRKKHPTPYEFQTIRCCLV